MYRDHFGLSEAPFRITPHTDFFFAGANRGATLEALIYAITHDEGIVKVTGEVGTGKTMLCRMLMERLPPTVVTVYLANPLLARGDILFAIADELDCTLPRERSSALLRGLQEHLIKLYGEGKQVVLLVDEAHAMPPDTLEEIRLMSNLESQRHKLMQIVLFGQPELNEILDRTEMRQLRDRVTQHFALQPLVRTDVGAYIDFRMRAAGYRGPSVFADTAVRRIARASGGLTRRINILADKSLLAAFAANRHAVGSSEARAAIRDAHLTANRRQMTTAWVASAVGAAAILTAAGGLLWQHEHTAAATAASVAGTPAIRIAKAPATMPVTTAPSAPAPASQYPINAPGTTPATTPSPSAPPQTPDNAAPEERLGPLTRQYLSRTETWLATASGDHWFLQLLTTDSGHAATVERFVSQAAAVQADEGLRVYRADMGPSRRIGVIYGDFSSLAGARAALDTLPPALRTDGAYPRRVSQLRPTAASAPRTPPAKRPGDTPLNATSIKS